jgi:flavin-dependent dehydrogenase
LIYDAIVIGAGPAGATAALLLARAGWVVAIVEKADFPRRKVCGEFVSATSLPLLREIGVEQWFLRLAGPPVRRIGLFAGDTVIAAKMPPAFGSTQEWGRALGREHLDHMLLQAAVGAGAEPWQPWRVIGVRRTDEGYACTLRTEEHERTLIARVLIAAYGSWERDPAAMRPRTHRASDLLAFKAHFKECNLAADLMPLLVFPGGYGGMVACDHGRVSLSCCIRRDVLRACRERVRDGSAAEAVLGHVKSSCRGVHDALQPARLDGACLSAGPIRPGIRRRHHDGIFFVGNIAGEAHPIVAEGISMAMQSAWLLCRRLAPHRDGIARAAAQAAVARAYDSDWRAAFATRIRAAALYSQIATRPRLTALALPLVERWPRILTAGALLAGKSKMLLCAR